MAITEGLYKIYYRYKWAQDGEPFFQSYFITHLNVQQGAHISMAVQNVYSNPDYWDTLNELHPIRQTPFTWDKLICKNASYDETVGYPKLTASAENLGSSVTLPDPPYVMVDTTSVTLYVDFSFYSDFSSVWSGTYTRGGGSGFNSYYVTGTVSSGISGGKANFFWLQYSVTDNNVYCDWIRFETGTYAACQIGESFTSSGISTIILNSLNDVSPYTPDLLTVTEIPEGSATYTVSTEGTIDTVTIEINEGYVLNSVTLYDPQDRLVQRWKELPADGIIQVRRDQPGEWKMRITCQEILSPYNPTVPIEDLPTDTITPTYPTDYIGKYIGAGFYKLFIPTVAQLNAFVNYLYTQTFIDAIMQLWNKMLGIEEMIVGVNIIPGAPAVAGTAIPKVGWVSMTESQAMNYTVQQYIEINLGSLDVTRAWGNYLDFAPYTKISIYLPFIGERTLDTNDVMGKTLNVRYNIDLLSGNCVAYVYVNGSIHYQFSGNCAYSIPISSADTANLFLQPLKAIAGLTLAGVGVATGNPMAVAAGNALGATVGSDENGTVITPPAAEISAPNVRKVDGLNANTGYMGTIRPYLSIERVKPDINAGFGAEIGYQSNKFRTLGNLAGFTKVSEVHLEGISVTTAELTQIEAMLKEGVII